MFIGVSAKVFRVICCILLLTTVITGKYWYKNQVALAWETIIYELSEDLEGTPDYKNSLDYNLESIYQIDSKGGWKKLSLQQQTETLSKIIKIECRYFGMVDSAPTLKVALLEEGVLGEFDNENDVITLSYQYLKDTDNDGYEILRVLLHEIRHRFQHRCVDLLNKVEENAELAKYANLLLFYPVSQYREEMENYCSGNDGSIVSYYLYSSQAMEVDADQYADTAVEDYRQRIQEYLNS